MQAWQQVKVINAESAYNEQAGFVVRTEGKDKKEKVFVRMDSDESVQPFTPAELQILC